MENALFVSDLARLRAAVATLDHVTETVSYGTPMFKVGRTKSGQRMLTRLREPGVVVLPVASEDDKFLLIEAAPEVYFTVPHYDGHALVLARMDQISDVELSHRLRIAWELIVARRRAKP
jgi:hypothetical protein